MDAHPTATRRRRRVLIAGLVVPILVLLSGCMRMSVDTTIVDDSHITLAMDIGIKKDSAGQLGATSPCAQMGASPLPGSAGGTTSYDDGTYIGCRMTGTTTLSALQGQTSVHVTHTGHDYAFSFNPSASANGTSGGSFTSTMIDQFKVSVTFPGKVTAHSGDATVKGNTVTWSNPGDADQTLTASGRDGGGLLPWWGWTLIGLALLVAAAAGVWAWLRHRRRSTPQTPTTGGTPWPPQPGQQPPYGWGPGQPTQQMPPQPQGGSHAYPMANPHAGTDPGSPDSFPTHPDPGASDDMFWQRPPGQS